MEKFARRCDATGKGINAGYVVGEGHKYFGDSKSLIAHLRTLDWYDADGNSIIEQDLSDDELMTFFFNEEYYYYTEWEEVEDDYYFDSKGNEYIND